MKINYAELVREAKDPPEIDINGKTYIGKLISYEQFLAYEQALYDIIQKPETELSIVDIRQELNICRSFLNAIFPIEKPNEPQPPAKAYNLWERIVWWITGKHPERWQNYFEEQQEYLTKTKEAFQNSPTEKIMALPPEQMWEVIRDLFTYQRGTMTMSQTEKQTLNDSPENLDSSEKESDESPQNQQ